MIAAICIILSLSVANGLSLPSSSHSNHGETIHSRRMVLSTLSSAILTKKEESSAVSNGNCCAYKAFDMLTFVYICFIQYRYPSIRFIAALGDPTSSSGTGAGQWGLWRDDRPRGVFLKDYDRRLGANDNVAPAGMIYA